MTKVPIRVSCSMGSRQPHQAPWPAAAGNTGAVGADLLATFRAGNPGSLETVLLVVVALLFALQNPLLVSRSPSFDASLFALIGKMWAEGLVLYRDMLDIKGPVIFMINALGYTLAGFKGIWLLEAGLWVWALHSLTRTLAWLGVAKASRMLVLLALLTLYGWRYYYGNMTEDYGVCLALIAQPYFLRLLLVGRFLWRWALVPAITFGLILFLRANNGALWGAYYLVLFLTLWRQGARGDGVRLFVSAVLGVLAVAGPCVLYFSSQGVLPVFWYYSFGIFFTEHYGSGFTPLAGALGLFRSGLVLLVPAYVLLTLLGRDQVAEPRVLRTLLWINLTGIGFTLIGNSVSGHSFYHYDISYLTFFFTMGGLQLAWLRNSGTPAWLRKLLVLALLSPLLFLSWHVLLQKQMSFASSFQSVGVAWVATLTSLVPLGALVWWRPPRWGRRGEVLLLVLVTGGFLYFTLTKVWARQVRPIPAWQQAIADEIRVTTGDAEPMHVDGYVPSFYVLADRRAATRYLFAHNVHPPFDVQAGVLADLRLNRPRYVVMDERRQADVEAAPWRYPPSVVAYYHYLHRHYQRILPRLWRRRTEG